MNRVPPDTSPADDVRTAGPTDWVSPAQAGNRRTSWRNLFAGIWPIHRAVLLGCVGAAALLALALVWYRQWAIGVVSDVIAGPACRAGVALNSAECTDALFRARSDLFRTVGVALMFAGAALAAGASIILGVSAFARDFEQRTQVFLLTQSVSRVRWWAAKTLLILVPWSAALLGLGTVAAWAFDGVAAAFNPIHGDQSVPMTPDIFYFSPLGLFTVGVVAVGTGVTAGILLRSTIGAVLVAGLLTTGLVGGAEAARPHLVPVDRFVSAYDDWGWTAVPDGSWYQRNGSLDAEGREVVLWTADCSDLYPRTDDSTTFEESVELDRQCAARNGVVSRYTDVILPSRFDLLRLLWSGGLLTASALLLLAGLLRIRRRVL